MLKKNQKYFAQLGFLLVLIIILTIFKPLFLSSSNIINVLRQISINTIVACGMTLVLISGGIDLAIGSIMAFAGMIATYISQAGYPFIIALIVGVISGTVCGLISGVILANTELPPFIVTYAMQSILRGIVMVITGAGTIRLISPAFLNFGGGSIFSIPYPVIYMILIILISYFLLERTVFGRHIFAIGGNRKAAVYSGISLKRSTTIIYAFSGFLAAFAGIILTSRNSSMQPSVAIGFEMDAIAAVVLGGTSMAGGKGSITGTIIGALIIGIINNGLNLLGMDSYYQYIVKGIVILMAVYVDDIKVNRKK